MNELARTGVPIDSRPAADVDGYESLAALALNLRWAWNHGTDFVWKQLDPVLWELTQNPWIVLQTVSRGKLEELLNNADFRRQLDDLLEVGRRRADTPAWFQQVHPQAALTSVAYFSMEYMLSEGLPIYSGGLGNVAGDQLKAASDLGVPVVGVGLLYQQGYFRQSIDQDGAQRALYPYNDPGQLPITPVRQPDGEWLRLQIALPARSVAVRVWRVQVGRVNLYLLDTNDAANLPADRAITSELYGGGAELRLVQELVLGIGGWRMLSALGIRPQVCHLNEGHAAFAILERARSFMSESGQPFEVALEVTRAGNLFTTHTAVAAGFDRFSPSLIEQYLGHFAGTLGISIEDLLALGRQNREDTSEPFNTAYLALRGSGAVNGVSRLHGRVSRHLFAPLFARWPVNEVPVGHVTNGVHMPTWDSAAADELWTRACGKDRWLGTTETLQQDIRRVTNQQLWEMRAAGRRSLIEYARKRLGSQLVASGRSAAMIESARHIFDPQALTLGFARRFATYKRPNLLLNDPARLLRLLTNPQRPVQLIVAGKAHPADQAGQALIQEWMRFIWRPEVRKHVIFLADHDMRLAERLVQGVDVWINTPRRPWEACGTSGMKVLVNGGINLSELDGWWAEAYTPEVGWAVGDGQEHHGDPSSDAADAQMLYDRLEQEVIPEFFTRDTSGVPAAWVARMRESMGQLTPHFCTSRTLQEYTERHYLPAARNYLDRSADHGACGARILEWQRALAGHWDALRFGDLRVSTGGDQHRFEVDLHLDDLDPDAVRIELYADALDGSDPVRREMKRIREIAKVTGGYVYSARVPATRPAADYTPRAIGASRENVAIPLEAAWIAWQR
jgi:starch phosphorylase